MGTVGFELHWSRYTNAAMPHSPMIRGASTCPEVHAYVVPAHESEMTRLVAAPTKMMLLVWSKSAVCCSICCSTYYQSMSAIFSENVV